VLRTHDKQTSAAIHAWLLQRDVDQGRIVDEEQIAGRTLLLRLLVEGLAMRAVRDPDLPPERVRALLADAIGRVMAD